MNVLCIAQNLASSMQEATEEAKLQETFARHWLAHFTGLLEGVAARETGLRYLFTPEGLVLVGCSRLETVLHSFRENGYLPWPDGSWTAGAPPWGGPL